LVDAAFDQLMASLDAPMVIVTTAMGDERAGCLVGFHSQCSIEPRRYVVWLSKANHTYRVALRSEGLGVHLLSADEQDLAELFGSETGDAFDKFGLTAWEDGPFGVPLLSRCANRFVGRRIALLDEGSDHVCVVLEPVDARSVRRVDPIRLHDVSDVSPGHAAGERPVPPTERA